MEVDINKFQSEAKEIEDFLAQPEAYASSDFAAKSRRLAEVNKIIELVAELEQLKNNLAEAEALLGDAELGELAAADVENAKSAIEVKTAELEELLIPRDPNDDKPVIVEIRAGAGGDEASLFAAELYRMYLHYADTGLRPS